MARFRLAEPDQQPGQEHIVLPAFFAGKRHAVSVAFGTPLSTWALDRLVEQAIKRGPAAEERRAQPGRPAAMATFQQGRFRAQCRTAVRDVPYYAQLGLDPADVAAGRVPITPKQALRAAPEAFVRRGSRPFMRITTTGTTGNPTHVHFSRREWRALGAISALSLIRTGLLRSDDIVHVGITPRAVLPHQGVTYPCGAVGAVVSIVGMVPPEVALPMLTTPRGLPGKAARVSVLTGNPSYIGHLVEAGLAAGLGPESFGVERLLVGGELLTAGFRRRVQQLFGPVRIFQQYALTEMVPFGGAMCDQEHLHFEHSAGLVEVIDPETGEAAAPGQPGTIVATPFAPYRETTLLLRYDTGDVVRQLDGSPNCTLRHLPGTSHLLGRFGSAVRHDAGWTFARDVAEALDSVGDVPLPTRYGFWAHGDGVAVEVMVRPGSPTATRERIADALAERGVPIRKLTTVTSRDELQRPVTLRCDTDEGRFLRPVEYVSPSEPLPTA